MAVWVGLEGSFQAEEEYHPASDNDSPCTAHSLLYIVTCFPLPQQYPLSPRGPTDATLTSYTLPSLRLVMVYEVVLEPDTERVV